MYFADLTPYSYNLPKPLGGVLNVGWLDKAHVFNRGAPPSGFVVALRQWVAKAVANQTRGYELCRFCPPNGYQQMETVIDGALIYLGAAEIWVPSIEGIVFASPNLILHYVEEHSYLPPPTFVEAIMRPIPKDWDAAKVAESMISKTFE